MAISETIQYVTILAITIVFSAFSLTIESHKFILKIIAGLCWFIMALTQFMFMGGSAVLAVPFAVLYLGLGFVFTASIVSDFMTEKKSRIWSFGED